MKATVFVIGKHDGSAADGRLLPGATVSIQSWQDECGAAFTPFFSSLEILQREISTPCEYLALPAKDLFVLTRGQRLILYAGGGFGKEFLPGEIADLLAADAAATN
jgi:flagellar biosynthesis/type III secretory pathway ATPase